MAYAMTKQGSLDNCITYEFICDTVADMNAIENRYRSIGSVAIVLQGESAGLEVYIAGSDKNWNSLSSAGADSSTTGGLSIYICGQDEVDELTGLPDIAEPDETSIYLVPAGETSGNLYEEYIYVDEAWEKFGSASIDLSNYIQNTDIATQSTAGLVKVLDNGNVTFNENNQLVLTLAGTAVVKTGQSDHPISVTHQHEAAFYGLAKAAGQDMKNSGNAVGTYTTEAASAIRTMIGAGTYSKPVGGIPANDLATGVIPDTSVYAPIDNPNFTGSVSLDRYTNSTVGTLSVALGRQTQATGNYSFAEGNYTTASGSGAHAEGQSTVASAYNAHAEGLQTKARGNYSHAEGKWDTGNQTITYDNTTYYYGASGVASHSEGENTIAHGISSHAEGSGTKAIGNYSHAEGLNTNASGMYSHAESSTTTASGSASHAEGNSTTASGESSHAEGDSTEALSQAAHAEGRSSRATAYCSHAEGYTTNANGSYSHAEGNTTTANHKAQHAGGEFNVLDTSVAAASERGNYVEIIGNGTGTSARSNARALDWSGNEYLKGDLYVGCDADSINGSKVATEEYVTTATSGYATQTYVNNAIPTKLSQLQNDIQGTIYGFHIDGNESDPTAKVTYLADAVGKTPAHMDFANDKFEYGGWEDAFFMPRPCMLKYDGTVDYYLDPTDYSKKANGTASDVADPTYNGNAMMEWGNSGKKIWYNIVPEGSDNSSASIYIADYQVNQNYKAYSFIDKNNNYIDHFYTPCYFGTIVNDGSKNVLRSLSGQAGSNRCKSKTATVERTMAQNNGVDWDMEFYCDIVLINLLLILIGKSTNTQAIFGEGLHTSGSDAVNDSFTSGQHDAKGLFYGTNSGAAATYTNAVKVFGMENWYGFMWRRFLGLAAIDRVIKYKMTANTADGSTGTDYKVSTTSSDYNTYLTGNTMPTASGTYIQKMYFDEKQFAPQTAAGTYQQNYCDGLWTNTGVLFAFRGGRSGDGSRVGAFALYLGTAASVAYWDLGAAPSCKPHKVII